VSASSRRLSRSGAASTIGRAASNSAACRSNAAHIAGEASIVRRPGTWRFSGAEDTTASELESRYPDPIELQNQLRPAEASHDEPQPSVDSRRLSAGP
jgi:hypothetical protein